MLEDAFAVGDLFAWANRFISRSHLWQLQSFLPRCGHFLHVTEEAATYSEYVSIDKSRQGLGGRRLVSDPTGGCGESSHESP